MSITLGKALIRLLEQAGVDTVFGIPGVHTVELYRGLDQSKIRHITPRHEQGAAFMADGYARVCGKPGVCLLITGPGLSNAATGILQARNDSIPMLVITAVNQSDSLGKGLGHLHEMPDQSAFAKSIFLETFRLREPGELRAKFTHAIALTTSGRPGPVHLEIPLDIMKLKVDSPIYSAQPMNTSTFDAERAKAAMLCNAATRPCIILGGGAASQNATPVFRRMAEALDAPVVSTANARGIMGDHPLSVPASPSLASVRDLVEASDLMLTFGSEMSPTDYDMYSMGDFPAHPNMIRVDIDPAQFSKRRDKGLNVVADATLFAAALVQEISPAKGTGHARATQTLKAARQDMPRDYQGHIAAIEAIWAQIPDAIIVGDSTQAIYAGNLLLNAPKTRSWFNSSGGFGTLGYAVPAAIGASLAGPDTPVICLTGDGGFQFTLAELGTALDTNANVAFVVWNNEGYREIETSMIAADVSPVGVTPSPPDLLKLAAAYGLEAIRITDVDDLNDALIKLPRPCLIEYFCP